VNTDNAEWKAGDVVAVETAIASMTVFTGADGNPVYRTRLLLETNERVLEPDEAYVVEIRRIEYKDGEAQS